MCRTASEFRTVTGSEQPPDNSALLQLRRLLIGGRAAAYAQRETVLGAESQIMADMAEQIAAGIMARDRLGWPEQDAPPDADPGPSQRQPVPACSNPLQSWRHRRRSLRRQRSSTPRCRLRRNG